MGQHMTINTLETCNAAVRVTVQHRGQPDWLDIDSITCGLQPGHPGKHLGIIGWKDTTPEPAHGNWTRP